MSKTPARKSLKSPDFIKSLRAPSNNEPTPHPLYTDEALLFEQQMYDQIYNTIISTVQRIIQHKDVLEPIVDYAAKKIATQTQELLLTYNEEVNEKMAALETKMNTLMNGFHLFSSKIDSALIRGIAAPDMAFIHPAKSVATAPILTDV